MKESILSIAQWHKETFPDATLDSQKLKWAEEKREWEESRHAVTVDVVIGDISELSDMFIVACGLTRFSDPEAMFCFATVAHELYNSSYATKDLADAIDEKMAKNRSRTWKNINGLYKHEGGNNA